MALVILSKLATTLIYDGKAYEQVILLGKVSVEAFEPCVYWPFCRNLKPEVLVNVIVGDPTIGTPSGMIKHTCVLADVT
jgi:hypothetical protein